MFQRLRGALDKSSGEDSTSPYKIDLHAHFLPPFYQDALKKNGHSHPDGMPFIPSWSPKEHLKLMDKAGISKSILSISSPGTHLVPGNDQLAQSVSRECNKYAADLKASMPDRFGYFASLPLPDIKASIAEIARAIDEGCDGFVLSTNVHGHYLGDKIFDPVFKELNKREALLLVHPTTPQCAVSAKAEAAGQAATKMVPTSGKIDIPMQEFFFETARVVSNLFLSGTMKRSPNIKLILPHVGGAFPPLVSRWTGFSGLIPGPWTVSEEKFKDIMHRQIWFDMAGFAFPSQIKMLMAGFDVPHTRFLYGSDFPFVRASGVEELRKNMDKQVKGMFGEHEIEDLYHGNAERLLGSKPVPTEKLEAMKLDQAEEVEQTDADEAIPAEEKEFLDRVRNEAELREQEYLKA